MIVGTHIKKNKQFLKSLKAYYENPENTNPDIKKTPCQIFTGSPKFWRRPNITKKDEKETLEYVTKNNLSVYIHSIYLCNLCKPPEEFNEKARPCLEWELTTGPKLGFKGVVVHCGKSLKMPLDIALNNMYQNMINLIPSINPSCPLLLETSSGQGSETLYDYQNFLDFYNRFTNDEKKLIKICIDTCHVFAAGNDPLLFIKNFYTQHPESIVLIHYNDSKECCGKKKDRHAFPGTGHIGSEKMNEIGNWCIDHNLPMVIEF